MPIRVVLLERGSPNSLYPWAEGEALPVEDEKWRRIALDLARQALAGNFSAVEVFLCLRSELLTDLLNYKAIKDAICAARAGSWGASIYVVVDNRRYSRDDLINHVSTFRNWFEEIY